MARGEPLWSSPSASAVRLGLLDRDDEVMIIYIAEDAAFMSARDGTQESCERARPSGVPVGLVVPTLTVTGAPVPPPGWMVLDGPLMPGKLEDSWELNARYCVQSAATIRQERALTSEWVDELEPGDEVITLELGFNREEGEAQRPRLRMKVSSNKGSVGWMSPETASGYKLLCPVNLLSSKVVEVHRKSLVGGRPSLLGDCNSPTGGGAISPGQRCSFRQDGKVPWEVNAQYRILERTSVRERLQATSRELFKLPAGCVVSVGEVQVAECGQFGLCPCALVTVADGPEAGRQGWIRCMGKDGRDQVDTRDQLEAEKVRARLEEERQQKEEEAQRQAARAREAEEKTRQTQELAERQAREREEREVEAKRRLQWCGLQACIAGCLQTRGSAMKEDKLKDKIPLND